MLLRSLCSPPPSPRRSGYEAWATVTLREKGGTVRGQVIRMRRAPL